jgi:hypothetical protein
MEREADFFNSLKKLNLEVPFRDKDLIVVNEGLKPCCRMIINDSKIDGLKKFCDEHGLSFEKSEHKVIGITDSGKAGWSTRDVKVRPETLKGGHWYCYISKKKGVAAEAKKAEESGDNDEFGKILGYPECCRKTFLAKSGVFKDNVLTTLNETRQDPPYSFYNNFVAQYFGFSLLSHFPCSFNCVKSARLAESYLKALETYSSGLARQFVEFQKSSILFTEHDGVFMIEDFSLRNKILAYDSSKIRGTVENEIFTSLTEGDNIKILGKNNVIIRRGEKAIRELSGLDVGMMVFG